MFTFKHSIFLYFYNCSMSVSLLVYAKPICLFDVEPWKMFFSIIVIWKRCFNNVMYSLWGSNGTNFMPTWVIFVATNEYKWTNGWITYHIHKPPRGLTFPWGLKTSTKKKSYSRPIKSHMRIKWLSKISVKCQWYIPPTSPIFSPYVTSGVFL